MPKNINLLVIFALIINIPVIAIRFSTKEAVNDVKLINEQKNSISLHKLQDKDGESIWETHTSGLQGKYCFLITKKDGSSAWVNSKGDDVGQTPNDSWEEIKSMTAVTVQEVKKTETKTKEEPQKSSTPTITPVTTSPTREDRPVYKKTEPVKIQQPQPTQQQTQPQQQPVKPEKKETKKSDEIIKKVKGPELQTKQQLADAKKKTLERKATDANKPVTSKPIELNPKKERPTKPTETGAVT